MARTGFDIMNHIGSIVIVGVTIFICLFCLILQLCKRYTRKRDEEDPIPLPLPPPEPSEPAHRSIGWTTSVMDHGDQQAAPADYRPSGYEGRREEGLRNTREVEFRDDTITTRTQGNRLAQR